MTAAAAEQSGSGRSPFADASPARIRAALTPEDAVSFDRQWQVLMARATEQLDLSEVNAIRMPRSATSPSVPAACSPT